MLLFGRDGVGRQTIQRVRFCKAVWVFENRISLRDGLNYSHQRRIDLDSRWTLSECEEFLLGIRMSSLGLGLLGSRDVDSF